MGDRREFRGDILKLRMVINSLDPSQPFGITIPLKLLAPLLRCRFVR